MNTNPSIKKIKIFVFGLLILMILCIGFISSRSDGRLHLVFCDVGQGDAIYIRHPSGLDMLVDGGSGKGVLTCLGTHMAYWDRTIEVVALTHMQKDHFGGLQEVLKRYTVKTILLPSATAGNESSDEFLELVQQENAQVYTLASGNTIDFSQNGNSSVYLAVLWPSASYIAQAGTSKAQVTESESARVLGISTTTIDPNTFSQVFQVSFGVFDALLTGDIEYDLLEKAVASRENVGDIEVLKIPHHGSKTDFYPSVIKAINPKLAVISVGKNSYGHPTQEVLDALADNGINTLRTDIAGDIEIISDGKKWWVVDQIIK